MSRITKSIFDPSTGIFNGVKVGGSIAFVEANIPEGMKSIDGLHDHLSKKIDISAFSNLTAINDQIAALHPISDSEEISKLQSAAADIQETKLVVEYMPPSPGDDYEWVADDAQGNRVRRWQKKSDVVQREIATAQAQYNIDQLERSQLRAVREAILGQGTQRLADIDAKIVEQREIISANASPAAIDAAALTAAAVSS